MTDELILFEYERLTRRKKDGKISIVVRTDESVLPQNRFVNCFNKIAERLAKFEDGIESKTLIELPKLMRYEKYYIIYYLNENGYIDNLLYSDFEEAKNKLERMQTKTTHPG